MGIQEIIVAIVVVWAVIYLVRYFIKQTKSHDCDNCSLMDMKKASDQKKKMDSKTGS